MQDSPLLPTAEAMVDKILEAAKQAVAQTEQKFKSASLNVVRSIVMFYGRREILKPYFSDPEKIKKLAADLSAIGRPCGIAISAEWTTEPAGLMKQLGMPLPEGIPPDERLMRPRLTLTKAPSFH